MTCQDELAARTVEGVVEVQTNGSGRNGDGKVGKGWMLVAGLMFAVACSPPEKVYKAVSLCELAVAVDAIAIGELSSWDATATSISGEVATGAVLDVDSLLAGQVSDPASILVADAINAAGESIDFGRFADDAGVKIPGAFFLKSRPEGLVLGTPGFVPLLDGKLEVAGVDYSRRDFEADVVSHRTRGTCQN